MEGDVAKAQRRHHRQRPVKAGDPGVVLPLPGHEQVKQDAEEENESDEDDHQTQQRMQLGAAGAVLKNGGDNGGKALDCRRLALDAGCCNRSCHGGGCGRCALA